jgi:acyl carrier protein
VNLPADRDPARPSADEIRLIVADVLEMEAVDISDEGDLVDDYEADSLLIIEITARLENSYGIQIPQQTVAELRNVRAIHAVVTDLGTARAS